MLRVSGHLKSFTLLFPSPTTGRWRKMALGTFPAMTLEEAKARAASLSVEVRDGIDPLQARLSVAHETFGQVVEAYMREHRKRYRAVTTDEVERFLRADVLPTLAGYRVDCVGRADVARVVEKVAERGAYVSADRVLTIIRSVFNWAIATGRLETNPTLSLRKRNGRRPRERVLSDAEIVILWGALDTTPHMSLAIRDALRLQLLLGLRIGETVGARRKEIDLKERTWTLPGTRTKNGREHKLPLPPMAFKIVSAAMKRGKCGPWLFPGRRPGLPTDRKSAPIALLRLRRRIGMTQVGSHDLRRTVATRLVEMGVEEAVVGRILKS